MPTAESPAPKTILLVEDNRADIRLIQEALKTTGAKYQITVARDGMEAMTYLQGLRPPQGEDVSETAAPSEPESATPGAKLPDLILLDLNLPRKDGREVLADIKADPGLRHIPVIVLTTSRNEEDIHNSYDLHVNCYIAKSRNLSELFKIVRGIESFWLETVTLPSIVP
jgi:two-component system, chemotaxis family, response regulator Rcp1